MKQQCDRTLGAAWALQKAVAALRAGNAFDAALFLYGLGHGVEDRSSPYHAWGGDRAAQHAADLKYGISVQARDVRVIQTLLIVYATSHQCY